MHLVSHGTHLFFSEESERLYLLLGVHPAEVCTAFRILLGPASPRVKCAELHFMVLL